MPAGAYPSSCAEAHKERWHFLAAFLCVIRAASRTALSLGRTCVLLSSIQETPKRALGQTLVNCNPPRAIEYISLLGGSGKMRSDRTDLRICKHQAPDTDCEGHRGD